MLFHCVLHIYYTVSYIPFFSVFTAVIFGEMLDMCVISVLIMAGNFYVWNKNIIRGISTSLSLRFLFSQMW